MKKWNREKRISKMNGSYVGKYNTIIINDYSRVKSRTR